MYVASNTFNNINRGYDYKQNKVEIVIPTKNSDVQIEEERRKIYFTYLNIRNSYVYFFVDLFIFYKIHDDMMKLSRRKDTANATNFR